VWIVHDIDDAAHRLGPLDLLALGAKQQRLATALADGDEEMSGEASVGVELRLDAGRLQHALDGDGGG